MPQAASNTNKQPQTQTKTLEQYQALAHTSFYSDLLTTAVLGIKTEYAPVK
ncbi:hypothetical protein AND4_16050 [Vibrio sp. AND4]|nr:hypothetical protein AND4_16050 [Vibrio sp. AND4]